MNTTWKGIYPATVTPFDSKGAVCFSAFEKHLEFLASEGVHGFVPVATTGESPTVLADERKRLLMLARQVADRHKLKVIGGCSGNSTPAVIQLVSEAATLGCDAVLVATPYYNKPTQAGLIAHYEAIAEASEIPIFLYNVPGRTAVNLNTTTVETLCQHERIIGIKEASGVHHQWLTLASRLNLDRTALMAGDDDAFATTLAMGGSGTISATANVAPGRFVEIFAAASKGDWKKAFDGQKRLLPLIDAMFMETNPSPAKYALELMGLMERNVRLPLLNATEPTQKRVAEVLKQLELVKS